MAAASLSNFVAIMTNFQSITEDAAGMAREVRGLIDANGPSVRITMSNVVALTERLRRTADQFAAPHDCPAKGYVVH